MSQFSARSLFSRLFAPANATRRNKATGRTTTPAEIDVLESRELLSATVANGVLTIQGEVGGNKSQVMHGDLVIVNPVPTDSTKIQVEMGSAPGAPQVFARNEITRIEFYGTPESDTFKNYTNIPIKAYGYGKADVLFGGSGDDTIYGGDGNDVIRGGLGNDFLYGDNDRDTIYGDDETENLIGGDDWVFGGTEADDLYDGGGSDHLIGGGGNDTFSVRFGKRDDGAVDFISLTDKRSFESERFWARQVKNFKHQGYLWE